MKKTIFQMLRLILVAGVLSQGLQAQSVFKEMWEGVSVGDSMKNAANWKMSHGAGEDATIKESDGKKYLAVVQDEKKYFRARTNAVTELSQTIEVRAELEFPSDESKAGAGFGICSDQIGKVPPCYSLVMNRSQGVIILYRVGGETEGEERELKKIKALFKDGFHEFTLRLDATGSTWKFKVLMDGGEMLDAEDESPVKIGSKCRVFLQARDGADYSVRSIQAISPAP